MMWKKTIILVISVMVLAISSSLTYEQQTIIPTLKNMLASKPFEGTLSWLHIPYWGKIVSIETIGYFHFIEFLIRKMTHFIGFGLIAMILYWFLPNTWRFKGRIVIMSIFFIALVDECRQNFTPGRMMSFQDVLLDTAGASCFIVIITIWKKYRSITTGRN